MSRISLPDVPYDILVRIALETACIDVLGPPTHLPPLLATCRPIYNALARSPELNARIFKAKFDVTAARRRFGPIALLNRNLAVQLKSYCISLKRFRAGDVHADTSTLETDLWNAFLMLTENDGKNAAQLSQYARFPEFAESLIRSRMLADRESTGWPVETTWKSLAMWSLWMMTDTPALQAEGTEARESFIRLLLPFILCCFRYNCFHAADIHYSLPLIREDFPQLPTSLVTAHGRFPQYPSADACSEITHFNQRITIARPPIVQAAQLLYFARRELNGFPIPMGIPRDREHALSLGQPTGPTRADYAELNAHPSARLLSSGDWDWLTALSSTDRHVTLTGNEKFPTARALSARFDADWERLTGCYSPWVSPTSGAYARYAFGALIGRWVGRMLIPDENSYMSMIENPMLHSFFGESFPFSTIRPFMLTLREYHCISPEEPVDFRTAENGLDDGVLNAYLPPLSMLVEQDAVTFTEQSAERYRHRYERILPGRPSCHNEDTCVYCLHRTAQAPAERSARMAEIEAAFQEAGLGRDDMDVDESCTDSKMSEEDGEEDEYEATIEDGPCNGVLDVVFTGITEERHGDAWCHYMYYGRLREWDGLIVLVGVPLSSIFASSHNRDSRFSQNDVNERLWGKWIFRGYLHGGQNFTGRWRHYAYDLFAPAYESAFTLSKRDDAEEAPGSWSRTSRQPDVSCKFGRADFVYLEAAFCNIWRLKRSWAPIFRLLPGTLSPVLRNELHQCTRRNNAMSFPTPYLSPPPFLLSHHSRLYATVSGTVAALPTVTLTGPFWEMRGNGIAPPLLRPIDFLVLRGSYSRSTFESLDFLYNQIITIDRASGLICDVRHFGELPDLESTVQAGNVVDLRRVTVLPGFVDAHVHLFLHPYSETSWDDQLTKEPLVERTIRAVAHARETLLAGFTTVRDLGTEGAGDADISLRRCLSGPDALAPGPRYFCANRALVPTGSYGPRSRIILNAEGVQGVTGAEVADGVEECRKAIRRQTGAGADWIKIYADYRYRSRMADVSARPAAASLATFQTDELKALIDTAHQLGLKIAAHASTAPAISTVVKLGVDTVEHGDGVDDMALFARMAQHGVTWVPTLAAYHTLGKADVWARACATFQAALATDVKIACGGDTGVFRHGDNALEMQLMVRLGADWRRVLRWATLGGWECVRSKEWEGPRGAERLEKVEELREGLDVVGDNEMPFGAIRKGFSADMIATTGDPENDFENAVKPASISFVMKMGKVYKKDGVALL
ncbi:uncharacterized protein FOMMEDRAFT_166890 [Fomitiporia mediterranea MF3/22]|uniref:uncharacterized protein n=1 Tax=Fomitiporia mediterranea (strain MF3/22) TaxID=694068 RepID=UPI00044098EF|nr:uncharacterized protein FOMMEDRAFT_166890 [Fomitiporia mediterranea MF3/22]EJD03492.1 hypothetical protein FOMMEDRAFT_166890 [Fomitiporia mediterranea MF3/22]